MNTKEWMLVVAGVVGFALLVLDVSAIARKIKLIRRLNTPFRPYKFMKRFDD